MNFFNENLQFIKVNNHGLYSYLCEIIDKKGFLNKLNDKFSIIKARDDTEIIQIIRNNGDVICLNSRYSPKKEADIWFKRYDNIKKITSLVMFGFGNGIIFDIIKKKLSSEAYVYIYEPDIELFLFVLNHFDFFGNLSDNRVKLYIIGYNDNKLYADLCQETNWMMSSMQLVCMHPVYDKIYNKECLKFQNIICDYKYAMRLSKNTIIKYAKKFTVNAIKNICFIKNSNYLGEFIGKIDDSVPVIIVSAGPSLDKNINDLKKAEKRAFILATDTAVKYLIANKINFDAIVTIDGDKQMEHLCDDICQNKSVFTIFDAKNELLMENNGRKIWISAYGIFEKLYRKYGFVFPQYIAGGSVATAAFWIAKTLQSKRIILVGQDLAYQGNNTHAGNIIDDYEVGNDKEAIYVDGIYGGKVKSRSDWVRYLQWFENIISQLDKDVCVVDATEGGARIDGTQIMKLSDAIVKYCNKNFNFDDVLKKIPVTFSGYIYDSFCKDISNIINEFDIIKENSEEGLVLSVQIIKILENQEIFLKNDVINMKLREIKRRQDIVQNQNVYILLDEYISEDIAERLEKTLQGYNSEIERIYGIVENSRCLFRALIDAVNELRPEIESVLNKM